MSKYTRFGLRDAHYSKGNIFEASPRPRTGGVAVPRNEERGTLIFKMGGPDLLKGAKSAHRESARLGTLANENLTPCSFSLAFVGVPLAALRGAPRASLRGAARDEASCHHPCPTRAARRLLRLHRREAAAVAG